MTVAIFWRVHFLFQCSFSFIPTCFSFLFAWFVRSQICKHMQIKILLFALGFSIFCVCVYSFGSSVPPMVHNSIGYIWSSKCVYIHLFLIYILTSSLVFFFSRVSHPLYIHTYIYRLDPNCIEEPDSGKRTEMRQTIGADQWAAIEGR